MDTLGFHHLLIDAKNGSKAAMDEVLSRLDPYLRKLASSYADPLRPAESTSDLVQEACVRAWKNVDGFRMGDDDAETFAIFRAWIAQIVRNLGLNARRDKGRKKRSPDGKIFPLSGKPSPSATTSNAAIDPPGNHASPSDIARSNERFQRIQRALENLGNEQDAAIVRMHLLEGLTLVEISRHLDREYEWTRGRFRVAVKKLERELEDLV